MYRFYAIVHFRKAEQLHESSKARYLTSDEKPRMPS